MTRFCYFCAQTITDLQMLLRGAIYCCKECRKKAAAELRIVKHGNACKSCLRKFRKREEIQSVTADTSPVLAESAQGCNAQESANADGGLTQ